VARRAPAGDGRVDTVYEVKLWDKIRALELAAAHLGLLKKKVSIRARLIWSRDCEPPGRGAGQHRPRTPDRCAHSVHLPVARLAGLSIGR
jgi:hypothetical protein